MSTRKREPSPASLGADGTAELLRHYGCGPVEFTGTDNALYERHLFFDNVVKLIDAGPVSVLRPSLAPCGIFSRSAGSLPRTPMRARTPSAFTTSRWSF